MYKIDETSCIDCGVCMKICPKNAIEFTKFAHTITDICISCGLCAKNCPVKAISKKED
ncbi:MAG: 4Fe-4S binding protein [Fusobacteriaceae bacterium]|nr:4Fe-4S binding protein [Fusobacteriaceae bacterium]MBN2837427.1 4Fe-4S binding protein [Fusobacteriaceae bacterium]